MLLFNVMSVNFAILGRRATAEVFRVITAAAARVVDDCLRADLLALLITKMNWQRFTLIHFIEIS